MFIDSGLSSERDEVAGIAGLSEDLKGMIDFTPIVTGAFAVTHERSGGGQDDEGAFEKGRIGT